MRSAIGIVSITFIVIQPILLGTWCTLCLIAAAAMVIQIPYSVDELVATGQFLARRHKAGRPVLRIFFTGDTDEGARILELTRQWAKERKVAFHDGQGICHVVLPERGHLKPGMFVVGGAGMKEIIKGIMDGNELMPVDVLYPPAMIATAMDLTVSHFKSNGPVAGRYILGATLVDRLGHRGRSDEGHRLHIRRIDQRLDHLVEGHATASRADAFRRNPDVLGGGAHLG